MNDKTPHAWELAKADGKRPNVGTTPKHAWENTSKSSDKFAPSRHAWETASSSSEKRSGTSNRFASASGRPRGVKMPTAMEADDDEEAVFDVKRYAAMQGYIHTQDVDFDVVSDHAPRPMPPILTPSDNPSLSYADRMEAARLQAEQARYPRTSRDAFLAPASRVSSEQQAGQAEGPRGSQAAPTSFAATHPQSMAVDDIHAFVRPEPMSEAAGMGNTSVRMNKTFAESPAVAVTAMNRPLPQVKHTPAWSAAAAEPVEFTEVRRQVPSFQYQSPAVMGVCWKLLGQCFEFSRASFNHEFWPKTPQMSSAAMDLWTELLTAIPDGLPENLRDQVTKLRDAMHGHAGGPYIPPRPELIQSVGELDTACRMERYKHLEWAVQGEQYRREASEDQHEGHRSPLSILSFLGCSRFISSPPYPKHQFEGRVSQTGFTSDPNIKMATVERSYHGIAQLCFPPTDSEPWFQGHLIIQSAKSVSPLSIVGTLAPPTSHPAPHPCCAPTRFWLVRIKDWGLDEEATCVVQQRGPEESDAVELSTHFIGCEQDGPSASNEQRAQTRCSDDGSSLEFVTTLVKVEKDAEDHMQR
ncbi:hypothetical protein BC832DRAFT_588751 [Gaertneriomyces semiglobifer]|nr:hypothetical protein BC832DRAFT_588751 [Gaertneriomyces semiglobifer]